MQEQGFKPTDIDKIEVEIFDVAYNIIGGGEEGEKITVKTKEKADHSLPYIIAVAILDGTVMPAQYYPNRILKDDVQQLLRKITIRPREDYSHRFPDEMPTHLIVHLKDGHVVEKEKKDYEGFFTRRMSWERAVRKFNNLSSNYASEELQTKIINAINRLDELYVSDLTKLLGQIRGARERKH
jgi:2-methylcitrate dehydratase